MIQVIIEDIPHGKETEAEILGVLKITRTSNGRPDWSDYTYIIDDDVNKSGKITYQFKSNTIWKLLYKILEQEHGE